MILIRQGEMKPILCTGCNTEQDGYTGVNVSDATAPRPGDVLVCWYCGAVNVLQDDGSAAMLTGRPLMELLLANPRLSSMVLAIAERLSKEAGSGEQPVGD